MVIKIHFKSGKTITQKGVKDYNVKFNGDDIVFLSLDLYWFASRTCLVPTVRLDQIECIERFK